MKYIIKNSDGIHKVKGFVNAIAKKSHPQPFLRVLRTLEGRKKLLGYPQQRQLRWRCCGYPKPWKHERDIAKASARSQPQPLRRVLRREYRALIGEKKLLW